MAGEWAAFGWVGEMHAVMYIVFVTRPAADVGAKCEYVTRAVTPEADIRSKLVAERSDYSASVSPRVLK